MSQRPGFALAHGYIKYESMRGWGIYNHLVSGRKPFYSENAFVMSYTNCFPFSMRLKASDSDLEIHKAAFLKFTNTESINNFDSIFSAKLFMSPISFDITGNAPYNVFLRPITYLESPGIESPCSGIYYNNQGDSLSNLKNNITIVPGQVDTFEVKNLIKDLVISNKKLSSLIVDIEITGHDLSPTYDFLLKFVNPFSTQLEANNWEANSSPRLKILGRLNISDSLFIPIIKGGTIKYNYNDTDHTINVYSIRNSLSNIYSQVKYSIDGFGNVKQKDIYTAATTYNTYRYKFNYMNKPSVNINALSDSTNFSYDGLERLIKTRNADTSSTLNSYSYYDSLVYTFGTVKNLIEKQRFTDEEGNPFDKYFDAVGNLRRLVKFVGTIPNEDFPPTALITDYKYDSLYRVTQVKTPNNKNIYYSYDGYGRQIKRITPDAGTSDFIYDKNNNLIYSQDANQRNVNSFKYTFRNYDGLNRLTGIGEAIFDIEDNPPGDGTQYVPTTASSYLTINAYDTISPSIVGNLFTGVAGYTATLNYTKGNLAATAYRTRKTDSWNFKYYRYDVRGRVIKMWNIISGFDTLVTDYSYNSQDQMTSYTHTKDDDDKTFKNTYDYAGRLKKADYYIGPPDAPNPDEINLCEYDYNANSQVQQQEFNGGSLTNDYFYNNRNWIIQMLQSNGLFIYANGYYKNGNVKTQQLNGTYNDNFASSTDLSYTYSYDRSNRLTASNTSSKNYELFNTYDNDGNILTLDRFGSGSQTDDFNYVYYTGTNKLQRVSGAGNQFSYDANGNLIQDALNNNNEMLYDHRNLITELKHRSMIIGDTIFLTKYYYDEAGNRIRKMTYAYLGKLSEGEPPANSDVSNTSDWSIRNDEVYSRDVSGREVAIYKNASILEYPFYGLDMIGKLKNDELHFYLKDHLGSVRAVVQDNKILSSQDYDAWGYILEGRTYQSEEGKFKFTGKERDEESFYDYFGARYYDARVGRWGGVEPLMEEFFSYSPYVYSVNSPTRVIDFDGKDVIVSGDNSRQVFKYLKDELPNLKLKMDKKSGKLSYKGDAKTVEEVLLLNAIDNPEVIVNLISTLENNIGNDYFAVGLYTGSQIDDHGIVHVTQYFNLDHAKIWREAGGGTIGRSVLHEVLEGYTGGYFYPGQNYSESYLEAHSKTVALENPPRFYPAKRTGVLYDPVKGVNIFNRKFLINANGVEHLLYTKDEIK